MEDILQRQERKILRKKLVAKAIKEQQKNLENAMICFELMGATGALPETKEGKQAKELIFKIIGKKSELKENCYREVYYLALGNQARNARAKKVMQAIGWKKSPTQHMVAMLPKYRRNAFIKAMRMKNKLEREA